MVGRVAGAHDGDVRAGRLELRQRFDHEPMSLVHPELVGQIDESLGKVVLVADPTGFRVVDIRRHLGDEPEHACLLGV